MQITAIFAACEGNIGDRARGLASLWIPPARKKVTPGKRRRARLCPAIPGWAKPPWSPVGLDLLRRRLRRHSVPRPLGASENHAPRSAIRLSHLSADSLVHCRGHRHRDAGDGRQYRPVQRGQIVAVRRPASRPTLPTMAEQSHAGLPKTHSTTSAELLRLPGGRTWTWVLARNLPR